MHNEAQFQNWLNHTRSIGYTDAEIRTILLKAGWSYAHVNELMHTRGLATGSARPNKRGHVVKTPPVNPRLVLGFTLIVTLFILLAAGIFVAVLN